MAEPVPLFLLPHAGGSGSSLQTFALGLPPFVRPVPVTLPGREGRYSEAPITQWPALIAQLGREIEPFARRPYAVFGHSLGALVAIELAHHLRALGYGDPFWIGASGCVAPTQKPMGEDWLACDDVYFIERLDALNGTPAEFLNNRELLELYLPALRADFHLASSYRAVERTPLHSRLLVLAGEEDAEVVSPAEKLSAWKQEVTGTSRVSLHPGGHFFIQDHAKAIAEQCGNDIAAALMLDEMHDA